MTEQEKAIWELVHNWCDKQSAEIPDYNRRVLMDKILHLHERYHAQVEFPSDEEIIEYAKKEASSFAAIGSIAFGAKWVRDHISKQLKQGI